MELLRSAPRRPTVIGSPDCTPGYYNNEGQGANPHSSGLLGYPKGPVAYFEYLEQWRTSGAFSGLEFRSGDRIVTSDEEHPGLLAPLARLKDQGVEIVVAPFTEVAEAVTPTTRLVAVSHVSWVSGLAASRHTS